MFRFGKMYDNHGKMVSEPWLGKMQPFRIIGGVYFIGTYQASTHIIDTGDGSLRNIDKAMLEEIGRWVKLNKNFIYKIRRVEDIKAENAQIVKDDKYYYAIIKDVPMSADPDVATGGRIKDIFIDAKIKDAVWLDNGEKINVKDGKFIGKPFYYGNSMHVRVARFKIAK